MLDKIVDIIIGSFVIMACLLSFLIAGLIGLLGVLGVIAIVHVIGGLI